MHVVDGKQCSFFIDCFLYNGTNSYYGTDPYWKGCPLPAKLDLPLTLFLRYNYWIVDTIFCSLSVIIDIDH